MWRVWNVSLLIFWRATWVMINVLSLPSIWPFFLGHRLHRMILLSALGKIKWPTQILREEWDSGLWYAADWNAADLQETQCSLQATRLSYCPPLFLVTQNAFWVTRGASEGLSLEQGSLVHSCSCLLISLKAKQQQKQANKKPKIMRAVIVHFWIL